MSAKVYVGNLPWTFESEDLSKLFEPHGEVVDARIVVDRLSGRSRGFGFVEMATEEAARAAIQVLNGSQAGGRTLTVDLARERQPRR